ncbi:MAG: hypothetical protein ACI4EI_08880 [Muricoprocola sp.]
MELNKYELKILIIDSSEDDLIVDDLAFLLCTDGECIGHEIIDQTVSASKHGVVTTTLKSAVR